MQEGFKFDFYFALAMIAIFGSAASLFLQIQEAGSEYEYLSSSMAPLVRSGHGSRDINEVLKLDAELDELEQQLETLDLAQ
ncbi:MAG: hypothetical protein HYT67_01875 [Candidatus Yanofskybacteria bacterium]|nr:hypothetical protein [Candidatus Yanofskybacteria bacterium]